MPKMPCHITDGPQEPEDMAPPREPDEDQAYETYRQECMDAGECITIGCFNQHLPTSAFCGECAHQDEDSYRPQLHTKVGKYTGTLLYSYDQAYWWSTPETAWRVFLKNKRGN